MKKILAFTALMGFICSAYAITPASNENTTSKTSTSVAPYFWYFKNDSDKPLTNVKISVESQDSGISTMVAYAIVPAHTRMPTVAGDVDNRPPTIWRISYTVDGLKFLNNDSGNICSVTSNSDPSDPTIMTIGNYSKTYNPYTHDPYVANWNLGNFNDKYPCTFQVHTPYPFISGS
jgi:hypothetical protein